MKTKTTVVAALAVVMALSSCKKQAGPAGADGTQGPSGPALTGNLKGYITNYDVSGVKMLNNLSGDTVKIDGTSTMAVTDANGMYTFSGITTGNYNLSISKAGFGNTKIQNISFTGGTNDLYRNANISKTPTTNVTNVTAITTTLATINNITISGSVTPQPYAQTVIIFVGNPGALSTSAASGNNINYYTLNVAANNTSFTKNIPTYEFYDVNYASGNTAYFAVYMIGANTNASSYIDFTNNRAVFTAISSTPANASVVLQ